MVDLALTEFKPSRQASPIDAAIALHRTGDVKAAAAACSEILTLDPANGPAFQLLGIIHAQEGKTRSSEDLFRRAVNVLPSSPEATNNLGMALYNQARYQEALTYFEAAADLNADYPIALNNAGTAYTALGCHLEAIRCYERAVFISPGYAEALTNLGVSLYTLGRFDEAVDRLSVAVNLRPTLLEARVELGKALVKLNRIVEAKACFDAVLAQKPDCAFAHVGLGEIGQSKNENQAAVWHYKKAIEADPELTSAHVKLGTALQELGFLTEAAQSFEFAIGLEPECPAHYLALVRLRSLEPDSPYLRKLLLLKSELPTLCDADKIDLHFALGKALSDVGKHETAFEHLLAGNALKRLTVSYDEKKFHASIRNTISVFTPGLTSRSCGQCPGPYSPIFIVGMPRSGSTLVEQILASHPSVFAAGETRSFIEAARSTKLFTSALPYPAEHPSVS